MLSDIKLIQKYLIENDIDAFIIYSSDPHCSEYMTDRYRTIRFFSSFTGSNGTLIITKDNSYLWTDGRYFIQAKTELKETNTILMKDGEEGVPSIPSFLKAYKKIATDLTLASISDINFILKENPKIEIIDEESLIDSIWTNRPSMPISKAYLINDSEAGRSINAKLSQIKYYLNKSNIDYYLLSSLDEIAWVYNLRGEDIPYSTVNYAFSLISKDKTTIYIDENKLDNHIIDVLSMSNVTIKPYYCIYDDVKSLDDLVEFDPVYTNYSLYKVIKNSKLVHPGFVSFLKAKKNEVEISNIIKSHEIDAIAMIKFIKFVKENSNKLYLDELSLIDKLENYRKDSSLYLMPSFNTICGFNSNGAIVHYSADTNTNKEVKSSGLLLVDSGGQYKYGTTDITRTIAIGTISEKMKSDFTLVLKAHIALSSASFSEQTNGRELDSIARSILLKENKNYLHGTGHGVGYMLNVHEGPYSISSRALLINFTDGIVISNEPGLYIENEYGIRHENLVLSKKVENGTLYFETLTLVPFDLDAINIDMLTKTEKDWLNNYHKKIYNTLSSKFDDKTREFLKEITKEI